MSKYTTEVRFICENSCGLDVSKGFDDVNAIIIKAAPKVFNFEFPIFDEDYRLPLEAKILRHFYTREISEETVGLWKLRLQDKLCTIMPYYNQLYKSELYEFNPLYDVDITTKRDVKSNGETNSKEDTKRHEDVKVEAEGKSKTESKAENKAHSQSSGNSVSHDDRVDWDLFSDTPQGGLTGIDENEYLTNARKKTAKADGSDTNNGTADSNGTTKYQDDVQSSSGRVDKVDEAVGKSGESKVSSVEDYVEVVRGKRGGKSYAIMLKEFREQMLNIDAMILDELSTLFFGLWD